MFPVKENSSLGQQSPDLFQPLSPVPTSLPSAFPLPPAIIQAQIIYTTLDYWGFGPLLSLSRAASRAFLLVVIKWIKLIQQTSSGCRPRNIRFGATSSRCRPRPELSTESDTPATVHTRVHQTARWFISPTWSRPSYKTSRGDPDKLTAPITAKHQFLPDIVAASPSHISFRHPSLQIKNGERGVRSGGERGVHQGVRGAAREPGAPLRGVQDRRRPGAGGGGDGGQSGVQVRRPHRGDPGRRVPLRRLRPGVHRRRLRGGHAPQQDLLHLLVPRHGGHQEQDGVRQLQRGVQEGAGGGAVRRAGHRRQRAHPRNPQGTRHLNDRVLGHHKCILLAFFDRRASISR